MSLDQAQLSALIDAAVREAVKRTTEQLAAKFEADTAGLRKNRDQLLAEKKDGEGKPRPWAEVMADFDKQHVESTERVRKLLEQHDRLMGKSNEQIAAAVTAHTISREKARDTQAYREAKAAAQKAGVELLIVDEHGAPSGPSTSRVKYLDDAASRTVYANREVVREAGGLQRLKETAERDGKRVVVFRSADDLPQHMQRAHAEILAANKPDTLLQGGGE